MHESPRLRRLRNDLLSLERLRDESTVLRFRATGNPAQHYTIEFHGKSLARSRGRVVVVERHQIEIKLGSSYPRSMPEIRWLTPIYHPNISEIGMVCLGGYGTHWVPSLSLDELLGMLWDMTRYHNYDVRSPYNRDAALWVSQQTSFAFPMDDRPLRDLRVRLGRVESRPATPPANGSLIQKMFYGLRLRGGAGRSGRPHEGGPVPEEAALPEDLTAPVVEGLNRSDASSPEPPPDESASAEPPVPAPVGTDHEPTVAPPDSPSAGIDDLIILDAEPEPFAPNRDTDRPVRLRALEEDIVFIE